MIRKTNQTLFEELLRIKSLINEDYKQILNESFGITLLKALAKSADELVGLGKLSDDLADIISGVSKLTDEAEQVLKLNKFVQEATKQGKGTLIADLTNGAIKNMDPVSIKNIDEMEAAFVADAKATGKLDRATLDTLQNTVRANLKINPELQLLADNIEATIVTRIKNNAEDAIAAGGGAGKSKTMNLLDDSFDDILRKTNEEFKSRGMNKQITREMLEDIGKQVDDIEKKFKAGEISQEDLYRFFVSNAQTIEDPKFVGFLEKIWPNAKAFFSEVGKGFSNLLKWVKKNGWNALFITIFGTAAYYGADYLGLVGKGKAEKNFSESDAKCLNTVAGYRILDPDQVTALSKITIDGTGQPPGCINTNRSATPDIKLTRIDVIVPTESSPELGFKLTFADGHVEEKFDDGGGATQPYVPPTNTTCAWKSEQEAKNAVKGAFSAAKDNEITVDLNNCTATYQVPGLPDPSVYTPDDL